MTSFTRNALFCRHYGRHPHSEKYVLSCLQLSQVVPGLKMYDILMREYVRRVHGKIVPDLDAKWKAQCWSCATRKEPQALKLCTTCKLARYCDQACQKKDWKHHKLLHSHMEFVINNRE